MTFSKRRESAAQAEGQRLSTEWEVDHGFVAEGLQDACAEICLSSVRAKQADHLQVSLFVIVIIPGVCLNYGRHDRWTRDGFQQAHPCKK